MIGLLLGFIKTDPLRACLIAGIFVTSSMLAWNVWITVPHWKSEAKVQEQRADKIEAQHNIQVAAAERERAETSERYRRLEQEAAEKIEELRQEVEDANEARRQAYALADASRVMYVDAESRYVAEQSRRAAKDPASAGRIDGETIAMLRELRRQTDGLAEEASRDADALRDQVIGLQSYVTLACRNEAEITSPLSGNLFGN